MNHPSLEQFLAACGSPEPIRVGVGQRDQLLSETWTFQQPFLVIGRSPDSDLVLDHWQVSRRHAYLQLIEGRYFCVDLGSRTGTHGGDASERSGWIEHGRAIQIGPFAVRPEWPEHASTEAPPMPVVTWEVPGRAPGQSSWRMDRHLVLIGRSPACPIRIVQPDVSKFHCSLVLTPVGVWAVDLLGQNGIFVNEEPVRCARLGDGDELRLGRHVLRIRYDEALPALATPAVPTASDSVGLARIVPLAHPRQEIEPVPADDRQVPAWPATGRAVAGFGGPPATMSDPLVTTLVHQFGQLQQQMFDQFHQAMMMMFEGFAALQREQAGSLREEFDQVRKLSQEIESLRAETARLADSVAKAEAAPPPPAPAPSVRPLPSATNGPASPPEPSRRVSPDPPDSEVDIHARLCRRLASIQTERQNRWQKILGMMSSRS